MPNNAHNYENKTQVVIILLVGTIPKCTQGLHHVQ